MSPNRDVSQPYIVYVKILTNQNQNLIETVHFRLPNFYFLYTKAPNKSMIISFEDMRTGTYLKTEVINIHQHFYDL